MRNIKEHCSALIMATVSAFKFSFYAAVIIFLLQPGGFAQRRNKNNGNPKVQTSRKSSRAPKIQANRKTDKKSKLPDPPLVLKSSQTEAGLVNQQWLSLSCLLNRGYFATTEFPDKLFGVAIYNSYTRQRALKARQELIDSPDWTDQLPCCPETVQRADKSPFFVAAAYRDEVLTLSCFHPDAKEDFRTSELYHKTAKRSQGQQCTYNRTGNLIKPNQPGAGTPDFVSPTVNLNQHLFFDVFPWTELTLNEYNSAWKPDAGCQTPVTMSFSPTTFSYAWLYVSRGDIINIAAAGTVVFDVEGNEAGPEGKIVIPKTGFGAIGQIIAPDPLPQFKPGALLGGVYTGDLKSLGQNIAVETRNLFYAGKAGDYTMPADGYLVFVVNDGYLLNNTGGFTVTFYRKSAR